MPKWSDFVSWLFFGLIAYFGYQLTTSVDKMSDSMHELNVKMAVVVEQVQTQRKDFDKLDARVERLETKKVR
jgi:ubiquinone biosynthesis protein UbiJ